MPTVTPPRDTETSPLLAVPWVPSLDLGPTSPAPPLPWLWDQRFLGETCGGGAHSISQGCTKAPAQPPGALEGGQQHACYTPHPVTSPIHPAWAPCSLGTACTPSSSGGRAEDSELWWTPPHLPAESSGDSQSLLSKESVPSAPCWEP